jgi:hypothetical protein
MCDWRRRTAPLSLEAFSNKVYFRNGVPVNSEHKFSENRDLVAKSSLRDILLLEAKQRRQALAIKLAKSRCTTTFDTKFGLYFKELKIKSLPPSSDLTIFLLNESIKAWTQVERLSAELRVDDFDFLACFMRKMELSLPQYGDRIYHVRFYDRSSVVYCGFCDDYSSARNPMSLKQAHDHFAFFHKKEFWKPGMLRQSPPGQPAYDGRCHSCRDIVLVAADIHETKSGVVCKNCLTRWCFKCMDKRVWVGADLEKDGVIHKGKSSFPGTADKNSNGSDLFVCNMSKKLVIELLANGGLRFIGRFRLRFVFFSCRCCCCC